MKMKFEMKAMGVALLAVLLFVGCDKAPAKGTKGKEASSFESLSDKTVLVRLNGRELTKKALVGSSEMRATFYKFMKPDVEEQDLAKVEQSTYTAGLPTFIRDSVILDASDEYTKKNGPYAEADRAAVSKWLESQYVHQEGQTGHSFKYLRRMMAKEGLEQAFVDQVNREIETELYLRVACSNRYVIEEFVISNVYARMYANNYVAAMTNRTILATASNVVARLKAGEDFTQLAEKYTMDPEYSASSGGDMGKCSAADFPGEEEIWDAVKELDAGQTTGLVDAGDSWQILKVFERDDSNPKESSLHLARIYFRRAWEIDRPSRESVIKALEDDRRQKLIAETLEARLPKAKIEFPVGTKYFPDMSRSQPLLDMIAGKRTNLVEKVKGGQR